MNTVIPYQEKILNDEIPGVEKSQCIGKLPYCSGILERGDFTEWFSRTVMLPNGWKV